MIEKGANIQRPRLGLNSWMKGSCTFMSATADPTKILDSIIYYYTCQLFHPPRLLSLMSGNILRLRDQVYRTTSNEFKRQKKLAKVIERKRKNVTFFILFLIFFFFLFCT